MKKRILIMLSIILLVTTSCGNTGTSMGKGTEPTVPEETEYPEPQKAEESVAKQSEPEKEDAGKLEIEEFFEANPLDNYSVKAELVNENTVDCYGAPAAEYSLFLQKDSTYFKGAVVYKDLAYGMLSITMNMENQVSLDKCYEMISGWDDEDWGFYGLDTSVEEYSDVYDEGYYEKGDVPDISQYGFEWSEDFYFEDDAMIEGCYHLCGAIKNISGENYGHIRIEFIGFDREGNQLDTYFDSTNNLLDGNTWKFDIYLGSEVFDVMFYDIQTDYE